MQHLRSAVVAIDAEVVKVAQQLHPEPCVLLLDRLVPMAPAPVVDASDGSSEARTHRLAPQYPLAPATSPPVEGEAEEVQCGLSFAPLLTLRRTAHREKASLV